MDGVSDSGADLFMYDTHIMKIVHSFLIKDALQRDPEKISPKERIQIFCLYSNRIVYLKIPLSEVQYEVQAIFKLVFKGN